MNMDPSIIILWALVVILAITTWHTKGRDGFCEGLASAYKLLKIVLQIIPLALLAAMLVAEMIPAEVISELIGEDTGFVGLLIASVAGGLVPSGPFLSFPLAMSLFDSGAGQAQIVAFLTGWSVYAIYRIAVWELPLMGLRFTALRVAASLILPLVAGSLAGLIFQILK